MDRGVTTSHRSLALCDVKARADVPALNAAPAPRPSFLRTPRCFLLENAARSFCMRDARREIVNRDANAQIRLPPDER
jgi:hypothetical protein